VARRAEGWCRGAGSEPDTRAATRERPAGAARAALGSGRRLEAVERVAGGTKKGVYRLLMDDSTTAIAHLWDEDENYWPTAEGDDDLAEPFSAASGSTCSRLSAPG
jgi:hypothetical protein